MMVAARTLARLLSARASFRRRLFWLVAGVGLATLLAVNIAWLPGAITEIREAQAELQGVAVRALQDHIRSFMEDKERAVANQARMFYGPFLDGDDPALRLLAHRFLQREPAFEEIGVVGADGRERFRLSRQVTLVERDLRDHSTSTYFVAGLGGTTSWGPVIITETSEPWVTVVVPLRISGSTLVGAVFATLNLKSLWTLTGDFGLRRGGRAYVVDESGRLIAASDPALVLKQLSFADRPIVRHFVAGPRAVAESPVSGGYVNENGTEVTATGLALPRPAWMVVVEQPRSLLATAVGRKVWFFAGLSVAGLLASFGAAHLVSRRVTEPITRLRASVEQLGRGDLSHRVAIETTDEVGELARQFNQMADQLHASHESLERRVAEATRDLSALYAVTAPVSQASDVKAVLDDAVVKIREVTQADAAVIHLVDEQGSFRHSSHFGLSPKCVRAMPITATETDIAALVVVSGEPHMAEDLAADPDLRPGLLAQEGFKSAAYLPLKRAEKTFGLMIIAGRDRGQISPRQADLFTAIAHQISVALENAHLYEAQKVRATRLRTLASLNQLVSSSLDADEVLGRISLAAADLMGAVVVEFWIADEATQSLKLRVTSASSPTADRPLTSLQYGQGAVGWVACHRSVLNLPDLLDDTRIKTPAWFRDRGLSSGLWVPLVFQDELLGVLSILGRAPFGQGADDQGLVDAFAAQAAVAIRNARLYASTQAQASALKMKNAELDAFAYSVSHDLKAPLVTVQGMAGMLLEDYGGQLDTGGRHYLERLQANARQMEHLISDLLTLSRIGREGHAGEVVHVTELVNELLMEMEGLILARGAKVIVRDVGVLYGVRTQLRQVFANFISNGIKYAGTADSPTVEVGMVDRGDVMECYVRDNGIGIDSAYHAKIFEMFQRLKDVEAEGTGVGLAIVKKIIEGAGGRVWVESTKGKGATFYFTWPKRSAVANSPETSGSTR